MEQERVHKDLPGLGAWVRTTHQFANHMSSQISLSQILVCNLRAQRTLDQPVESSRRNRLSDHYLTSFEFLVSHPQVLYVQRIILQNTPNTR